MSAFKIAVAIIRLSMTIFVWLCSLVVKIVSSIAHILKIGFLFVFAFCKNKKAEWKRKKELQEICEDANSRAEELNQSFVNEGIEFRVGETKPYTGTLF